jgi:hypothetical protein
MAKYKVLRPIEHSGRHYVPADHPNPPEKIFSGGNGAEIAVDRSGWIDLDDKEAAALVGGQVPLDEQGKPVSEAERKRREKEAADQAAQEATRAKREAEERAEFEEFKAARAKKR